ncbi:MAG: carboxypeptidase M32 [Firmicutes bacterium]|nr:carboxypeptidase M32 [Bacillota bacterium]
MNLEQARQEFANIQKNISALNYAIDLLTVDGETEAPPNSAANRVSTFEILNDELFDLKFGEKMVEVLECLKENANELSRVEIRSLEVLRREADRMKCISQDEYVKYQGLLASTGNAWDKASEEGDYELVRPYLEKIFDRNRDFAAAYDKDDDPYNYCLNTYEPGSSTAVYDAIFDDVKENVVPLLKKIQEKPPIDDSCLQGDYSAAKQKELALYIMELMGVNMDNVGLSTAEHPFIRRIGSHLDERMSTRYSRKNFTSSLYTILFGCGFVLAEYGQGDEVLYTLADGSASVGIVQGQTRFYENIVGRSRQFIEHIYPKLKSLFPTSIKEHSSEDLYLAVNKVEAGPIRVGSDEVTSNLHILVRYELERALMSKDLSFKDLPDAWADKYLEYLGVEVRNHKQGILQDITWAEGNIGYFPTAVIGTVYSALMLEKMKNDIDVDECGRKGDMTVINEWNREHIWRHMGLYDSDKVVEELLEGSPINGDAFIKYLNKKYSEIYRL